jgi:hypothetical protein
MLRPRALVGAESDIAENVSATDALEPAAARPKKAFWVAADLDWPATARDAQAVAAMDMVIAAILKREKSARLGGSRLGEWVRKRGDTRRDGCGKKSFSRTRNTATRTRKTQHVECRRDSR